MKKGITKKKVKHLDAANLSDVNRNIIHNFIRIRKAAGLTQTQFAESIDVGLTYIKALEQGRFTPTHSVILDVSNIYKRTIDWIYRNEG